MRKSYFGIFLFLMLNLSAESLPSPGPLTLWYTAPAKDAMNEALPVGNGHLGALVFGGVETERIVLNEISFWTGTDACEHGDKSYGAYQCMGDLFLDLPAVSSPAPSVSDYRRDLDLSNATSTTRFTRDGVSYTREVFVSKPDDVMVVRWTANQPGAISGTIRLEGAHNETTQASSNSLSFGGNLNSLNYETTARVIAKGGMVDQSKNSLQVKNCDEVLILLVSATNYVFDYSKQFRDNTPPHDKLIDLLEAASQKPFDQLKADHVKNFQELFNRVSLDFGKSTPEQTALPTNERKVLAAKTTDPELETLMVQYGRYLLISSSRPGSLPANLQGVWNDRNRPAWNCDYHANINVQMNYWPAETANISECHLPLFNYMKALLEPWRKNSQNDPEFALNGKPARGWAVRTGLNIWGGETFKWDKTANAWLCQHLWEHYAFTQDKEFLKETAYPMIKEIVEFWEDHLKELPDGRLVVPHGWSPEHGPDEDGVSYNQQIVWDLFTNYIEAADVLQVDQEYRNKIADMRDKLVGPAVGSWGQLLEWMTEKKNAKELDTLNDHHRHTSHLFAVYPGRQISQVKTPDLAKAAKVSLDARGPTGDVREWSFAWRTALYARLHDAENAHAMFMNLFADRNSCLNLFGLHPPLQLDGNFGITAGVIEMLVQSHEGEINLLPALPKDWKEGSAHGLRARGGFEVDLEWKDGSLSGATIKSISGTAAKVRYQDKVTTLNLSPGQSQHLDGELH